MFALDYVCHSTFFKINIEHKISIVKYTHELLTFPDELVFVEYLSAFSNAFKPTDCYPLMSKIYYN